MALSKNDFSNYIKAFNFRELFNDMGWNNAKEKHNITVDNNNYTLQEVAEKSGFVILICNPLVNNLPDYATRKKIDAQMTKLRQEHLLIFIDKDKTEQIWQLVVKQTGKPAKLTETLWNTKKDTQLLYQRASGMFFEINEEGKITIIDVKQRVGQNFQQNNEKVTKSFYDKFKKEHAAFLQFITGIPDKHNQDWYASLMLNRLMFCYFIQKKGFLDNNKNYLRDKLNQSKENKSQTTKGKQNGAFFSFYKDFLLVLFHNGLNEPNQIDATKIEIGNIPYLNGGLFDQHEIEKNYNKININDKAFKALFDFFDQYEWHLDTSTGATGKDINPDVIGYIFEKYINDRANMGAYYTKEDITDYISKNCILPFLFDETKRNYPKAFSSDNELWENLKASNDTYIYDAVKKGTQTELPQDITQGIEDVQKRQEWNKPATLDIALPTEIWREVVERRKRYTEIKNKINEGQITQINDFITYNLDIRQFAQDAIQNTNDPKFLEHFYKALNNVTIIDPTCGSGAFLFAAMNILEPLYEACLLRMRTFTEDEDRLNKQTKHFNNQYKHFRKILEEVQSTQHPNQTYFIYKNIILHNLYGVDIMREAVEIAKLRLFLKLVAEVDADDTKPNFGLEPLPDIDFNIRAGNTLVGFATEAELQKGLLYTLEGVLAAPAINEKCDVVAKTFAHYKEIQLSSENDFKDFKIAKDDLNKRLKELNNELNLHLHKQASSIKYDTWLQTHQPFHWFAEFYDIIAKKGGFDVIIGNPPYVEYSEKKSPYKLKNYLTVVGGNLYAYCIEKGCIIANKNAYISMIVPISLVNMPTYENVKKSLTQTKAKTYFSNYSGDTHPGTLFQGVQHNLTIFVKTPDTKSSVYTTNFIRFYNEARQSLLENLEFVNNLHSNKISNKISLDILTKLRTHKILSLAIRTESSHYLYMKTTSGSHYKLFFKEPPFFSVNGIYQISSSIKPLYFNSAKEALCYLACLNSNLFNFWWCSLSDGRNVTKREVGSFPCLINDATVIEKLANIGEKLMNDLKDKSKRVIYEKQKGTTIYDQYKPRDSKSIIDEIDVVLGLHYGFSAEELDFIINYDIKYRMGKELDAEEE